VTFALAILASFEAYDRTHGGDTHSDPVDRLLHFLDQFAPEQVGNDPKTDPAWFAAIAIVCINLENSGRDVPKQEFQNLRAVMLEAKQLMG
jgi:hypothetical protein